jgi:hypothetical protein
MTALDEWAAAAARELGVDPLDDAGQRLVLDVAREVAHGVLRPGAPVTAYLLGLAVGRGASLAEASAAVVELVRRTAPPAGE